MARPSRKKQNSLIFRKLVKICLTLTILLVFLTLDQVVVLNFFTPPFTVRMAWNYINQLIKSEPHHPPMYISMQTARTIYLLPDRGVIRKTLEAYYTLLIELIWNKRLGPNATHPALNNTVKWKYHYDFNHQRSIDFQPSTSRFAARGPWATLLRLAKTYCA
jgi:hypothetical protein